MTKKHTVRHILGFLLCLLMAACLIPSAAHAEGASLTVNVTDSNKAALAGATFTLTNDSDYSAQETSDENGNVTFENVPAGTYTLLEQGPFGYKGINYRYTITVATDGKITYY